MAGVGDEKTFDEQAKTPVEIYEDRKTQLQQDGENEESDTSSEASDGSTSDSDDEDCAASSKSSSSSSASSWSSSGSSDSGSDSESDFLELLKPTQHKEPALPPLFSPPKCWPLDSIREETREEISSVRSSVGAESSTDDAEMGLAVEAEMMALMQIISTAEESEEKEIVLKKEHVLEDVDFYYIGDEPEPAAEPEANAVQYYIGEAQALDAEEEDSLAAVLFPEQEEVHRSCTPFAFRPSVGAWLINAPPRVKLEEQISFAAKEVEERARADLAEPIFELAMIVQATVAGCAWRIAAPWIELGEDAMEGVYQGGQRCLTAFGCAGVRGRGGMRAQDFACAATAGGALA